MTVTHAGHHGKDEPCGLDFPGVTAVFAELLGDRGLDPQRLPHVPGPFLW